MRKDLLASFLEVPKNIDHELGRFRQVATFGRDTIRRFSVDIAAQKRIAARDYEDILQVCTFIAAVLHSLIIFPVYHTCLLGIG